MVADEQQVSRAKSFADSSGGGRQDQDRYFELLDHSHRERDGVQVVALVVMESALKDDHRLDAELAANDLTGMARYLRDREIGNPLVRYDPGVLDACGK